ncbi:hypothetical protein KBB96_04130 [Luteolibacter ambystomatis]|uniref:MerC domain-containing protein n=1 Tax=Luteolibacter ambystomatis TaxID=2824561 RepID=A0A975J157_9BACT|nr:hypothetical protein [Luteolibacter ambystomatis]QUE52082.1 hypothetical protein KBB96_04130 [Luteolibacter ambystomatis]
MPVCPCESTTAVEKTAVPAAARSSARTAGTLVLSILVAFFPKCPMCWAAYCSALGLAGLAGSPYMEALLPVLVAMLGFHLISLGKQANKVGYGPLLISVAGAATVFLVRRYAPATSWALNGGILLIVGGSVWNSLAMRRCVAVK